MSAVEFSKHTQQVVVVPTNCIPAMANKETIQEQFFRSVQGDNHGKSPTDRGLMPFIQVNLYVAAPQNAQGRFHCMVGQAISERIPNDPSTLADTLHGHKVGKNMAILRNFKYLPFFEKDNTTLVKKMIGDKPYPYVSRLSTMSQQSSKT